MGSIFHFLIPVWVFLIVSGCAPSLKVCRNYIDFFSSTCADVSCSRYHRCKLPKKLEHLWTKSVGYLDPSEPVIFGDIVIVSVPTKRILGFSIRNGSFIGEIWTDASMRFPPTVMDSLLFYAGSSTWNTVGVYNLKRGKKLWSRDATIAFVPPMPVDTFLIFLTAKGKVYCMSAFTGKTIWQIELPAQTNVQPIEKWNSLWIASGKQLFKVSVSDGQIIKKIPFQEIICAIAGLNSGMIVQSEYSIFKMDYGEDVPTWSKSYSDRISGICVRNDSILVCTTSDAKLIFKGKTLWSKKFGIGSLLSPVACDDGFVISSISGKIATVDFEGNIVGQYDIGQPIRYPPAVADGIIVIPAQNGDLVAIGEIKN